MAQIKEVSVGVSFLKSLPNYQNIRFDASTTLTLTEGDNPKKIYEQAWEIVGDEVSKQVSLFEEDKKSGVKKGLS